MTDRRHPEYQYLRLLETLLSAPERPTRNDTATRSLFSYQMEFDIGRHGFPLLTTKKLPFRIIAAELLWFMSGSTNAKVLEDQGVNIWREWGDPVTRELGPVYGEQMRRQWGLRYLSNGTLHPCRTDQIANVLDSLRKDPHGRRHIVNLWNPAQSSQMALPPCHMMFQFYVESDHRLSLKMYQRSADVFLGVPFNIASYALLLCMFARVLDRPVGRFIWDGGDVHLYGNHREQAEVQILREPRQFPELFLQPKGDMDTWSLGDMTLSDYQPWPHIAAEVSA